MLELDVASLDEIPLAGAHRVDANGEAVLLFRSGETVSAIGATCPHAGAPLEQGVRHGDRLVCPWHKATFCVRSGVLLEPPAVDPLPCYDVLVADGRVLLTLPARAASRPAPVMEDRCFVIVGGGAAGAVAAQTLRQEGFAGRLVLLDQENRVPYDRTVLSKYFLSGAKNAEKSPLQKQSFYREHVIERLTAQVTSLDAEARVIQCADGWEIAYDAALIATGGTPKRPSLPGANQPHVFLLRNRVDADALLAAAERSKRAVVLGASFIGMEVAASLRERGLDVTIVGPQAAPFEKQLGEEVGRAFVSLHKSRGVAFRLGSEVSRIDGRSVVLADGEILSADLVVIGFGVTPAIDFVQGLALHEDGGIPVDAHLLAAPGLYAAGDIAQYPAAEGTIRVEHWRVAEQQGRLAALNMLGRAIRYDAVPVFWTIQYMKRLDYIGHATEWDEVVIHGDLEKPEFLAYYVREGVVAAAVGLDRDTETAALVELMTNRRDWRPEELGDRPSALLK